MISKHEKSKLLPLCVFPLDRNPVEKVRKKNSTTTSAILQTCFLLLHLLFFGIGCSPPEAVGSLKRHVQLSGAIKASSPFPSKQRNAKSNGKGGRNGDEGVGERALEKLTCLFQFRLFFLFPFFELSNPEETSSRLVSPLQGNEETVKTTLVSCREEFNRKEASNATRNKAAMEELKGRRRWRAKVSRRRRRRRRHFAQKKASTPSLFSKNPAPLFSTGRPQQQPRAPRTAGASSSGGHGLRRPGGSPLQQRLWRRIEGQAPPSPSPSLSPPPPSLRVWRRRRPRPPAGARRPLARQAQVAGPRQGQGGAEQPDRRGQVVGKRRRSGGRVWGRWRFDLFCRERRRQQSRRLWRRRSASSRNRACAAGHRPLGVHGQARPPLRQGGVVACDGPGLQVRERKERKKSYE